MTQNKLLLRFYKFILHDNVYIPEMSLLFLDLWIIFITFSPYSALRGSLQRIFSSLPAIVLISLLLFATFITLISLVLRKRIWKLTSIFLNTVLFIWITSSLLLYPQPTLSLGAFIAITIGAIILYFRTLLLKET